MDKNKLIIPSTIIVSCLILGGFYYLAQINKQSSIERQQRIELETKQRDAEEAASAAASAEAVKGLTLGLCIEKAEDMYWRYMELNGTGSREEKISAPQYIWDQARDIKQMELDICYKRQEY